MLYLYLFSILAKYYEKKKETIQKKVHEWYLDLSKEKRKKIWQYGHEWYKTFLRNEISWLSIEKNIIKWEKNRLL